MILITTIKEIESSHAGVVSVYIRIDRIADGEELSGSEIHSIDGAEDPKIEDSIIEETNYMLDNNYKITKCFKSNNKFVLIGECE